MGYGSKRFASDPSTKPTAAACFPRPYTAVSQIELPGVSLGELMKRLAHWCRQPGAGALISDGGLQGRFSYLLGPPDAVYDLTERWSAEALHWAASAVDFGRLRHHDMPPFCGGVIGIASFEFGLRLENLEHGDFRIANGIPWPELMLRRHPGVLAFDHAHDSLVAVGLGCEQAEADTARDALARSWSRSEALPFPSVLLDGKLTPEISDAAHEDQVAIVVRQIHAGDLFQANLARGWTGTFSEGVHPSDAFAAIHQAGASPFGACLDLGDGRMIVSNSPERFIRLDGAGRLETRPIKGTRPRGETAAEDAAYAAELCASEKDRAENLMIVDLMRHDLSKVSRVGSVKVEALHVLESFPSVHHLVSTISARLAPSHHANDLLFATLPPGSVSGAPKVQAMKVISALEPPRGPYCGSLFILGPDGQMDSSVLIRTIACEMLHDRWHMRVAAGGGIVADSDHVSERQEADAKLALIRKVLETSRPPQSDK